MVTSVSSVDGFRVVGSETADMTLLGPVNSVSEMGDRALCAFDGLLVNSADPASVPLD